MKNSLEKEKILIEKAKKDIKDFKLLYEKYVKILYRYCYYRLGKNKDLTEDITSETFVKAIENFGKFTYQNKLFITWLYTIAHNLIVNYYRDKKERNVSLSKFGDYEEKDDEDILIKLSQEEFEKGVGKVLRKLSDDINNIFTLRHAEDLSFAQIAKLLGKSEGAVKMRYYRGLGLLKNLLLENKGDIA